jgi:trans-2,3-dihydro-3-hydroxyanthranilate isomerase
MPTLHYRVVDVFTDRPFAGNPLVVVLDADDLDTSDLARLARQLNLSETAFPMLPTDEERAAGADYRLRVFTPWTELAFAGHPSIGAAWVLAKVGRVQPGPVRQASGGEVLSLRVSADGGPVELAGPVPVVGGPLDHAPLLAAASLPPAAALAGPARTAGTGNSYQLLRLSDERDVVRAAPDLSAVRSLESLGNVAGLDVFAWDAEARTAHSRVFSTSAGSGESPASGSAAMALGAYLVSEGLVAAEGESQFTVWQGAEIGRPARLECSVVAAAGTAVQCRVSGAVAGVASGEIRRPPVRR